MAEEHNLYPWKGPDDDSSWQPSHIAKSDDAAQGKAADQGIKGDSGDGAHGSQDAQETQNFGDFGVPSIPDVTANFDEQKTTSLPTVEGGADVQQTSVIPTGDNTDTSAFNDLGGDKPQYDGFVAPRSSQQPEESQTDAAATFQSQQPLYAGEQVQQSQLPEQGRYEQPQQYADDTSGTSQEQTQGAQPTQSMAPQYRPAPQYGAYAPAQDAVPQQPQQQGDNPNAPYSAQQNQFNPFAPEYGNGNTDQQQQAGSAGGQIPPQGPSIQGQNGGPHKGGRGKAGSKTLNTILVAVIAAVLSAALMLGLGWAAISNGLISTPTTSSLSSINSNSSGSGSATAKSGEAADWEAVSKSVSNSVVAIDTVISGGTAKGSGAIIDTSGDVVTNNHVVEGATQIQVTLSSGQIYSAKVVGTDTTTDLAVIKIQNPPSDLQAITFADSDSLAVGESVMAIGNPLGYDNTATTGIVSALNRPVSVMDDTNTTIVTNAVQIDAAINPGNSGGPTFNAAGQVIGINSSIASTATTSSTAGSIGIGFAIPSNLVKRVANEIIKNGSVQHVVLGITIQSATAEADGVTRAGAQVTKVTSGSAAANGGVKAGDTIVAFNGNAVNSNYALLGYVRASALGDKVTLTVVRSGKTLDLSVTLDQKEATVSGSSKSDSDDSGSSGSDGDSGSGSDDGGLTDPYGLFGN
jgi:putative serine protease PepD